MVCGTGQITGGAAVTIVFRLPPSAAERVAFSYSPALEAVLSLHVLVEPKIPEASAHRPSPSAARAVMLVNV
jgi:hypothetical protein